MRGWWHSWETDPRLLRTSWSSATLTPSLLWSSGEIERNVMTCFVVVQLLSCVWLFEAPWTAPNPGFPVFHYLPELAQTHVHWVSYTIQPSHPLSSPSPPAFSFFPASGSFPMSWFFTSGGQSFGASASASVLPMNIQDWFPLGYCFDLLAVQGTLKSLLQHHSSKATILWHSAFFTIQLSCPYMFTGKTIALTIRNFVGKVMSLLFNMLSRLVIDFPPRSKCLLISWLQSPSAAILDNLFMLLLFWSLLKHLIY